MSSSKDPAATDLDYYMKPENYEGSSLQSFKKFQVAKDKEDKEKQVSRRDVLGATLNLKSDNMLWFIFYVFNPM